MRGIYACMRVCVYARMHVCMYARMHLSMHACMYVVFRVFICSIFVRTFGVIVDVRQLGWFTNFYSLELI